MQQYLTSPRGLQHLARGSQNVVPRRPQVQGPNNITEREALFQISARGQEVRSSDHEYTKRSHQRRRKQGGDWALPSRDSDFGAIDDHGRTYRGDAVSCHSCAAVGDSADIALGLGSLHHENDINATHTQRSTIYLKR